MKITMKGPFLLLVGMLLCFGCGGQEAETDSAAVDSAAVDPAAVQETEAAVPTTDPLEGLDDDAEVATVNGESITCREVERKLDDLSQRYGGQVPPQQLEQMRPTMAHEAVGHLVSQKLLLAAATGQGIEADPQSVEDQFSQMAGQAPSPEEFQKAIESLGFSEEQLRVEIANNQIIEQLLQKRFESLEPVSDDAVRAFFDENPDQFKTPEQVRASHILITVSEEDTDEIREEKRQKLADLRTQIENGSDFATVAGEHSDCPSKSKGGDLGLFTRDRMVKPFSDAAFAMEVDGLSDIVETRFGYHLIKLTERNDADVVPFDTVKERISAYLLDTQKGEEMESFLEQLRGDANIEYAEGFEPAG